MSRCKRCRGHFACLGRSDFSRPDPRRQARSRFKQKLTPRASLLLGNRACSKAPCGELINEPGESLPEIVVPACRLRPLPSAVDTPNALGATITQCRLVTARAFPRANPA